jgi:hypothetical protein
LQNKLDFIGDYEIETILYIDRHEEIPSAIMEQLESKFDDGTISQLIILDHTKERYGSKYGKNNNDLIYAQCLAKATGDYVIHFDADVVAYRDPGYDAIAEYVELLKWYKFISIPSFHTPNCVPIDSPIKTPYRWASTRFFICKRESIPSFDEMVNCFDNAYLKDKYGQEAKPNCLEHILGVISNDGVLYPPMELEKYLIVSWAEYWSGTIQKLNSMPFEKVVEYIEESCGGIHGANDVIGKQI